jgi:hypothetical protein
MILKTFLAAVAVAALGLGFDGAADVARIREEFRKAQPEAANRTNAALLDGWLQSLWNVAADAPSEDARFGALLLALQISDSGSTDSSKSWREKVRGEVLGRYCDDAKRMGDLMRASASPELRKALLERTKNKSVKAMCLWSEAGGYFATLRKEKLSADAQKRLDEIMALLTGELAEELDTRGRRYGDVAAGKLRSVHELVVGKVAPDIEGKDLDGASFKLSEYRGKIVVLDFWGNW